MIVAALLLIAPPLLAYYLWICTNSFGGALVLPMTQPEWSDLLAHFPKPTFAAMWIYAAWFLFQMLLQIAAPGKTHAGEPLADGTRLKYKMNGWFSFWFTLVVAFGGAALGWWPATLLYDQFGALLSTVNIFAFAFAFVLYFFGKSTGNPISDYFRGTALNPRVGSFDLKLFCEARPGLLLWILVNASFAARQYEVYGRITTPMLLVNAFQFLYVADYFYFEDAILTTWDIRHEKFGWMLCWGNLVWVPFTFTLQAQYLVHRTHELSAGAAIAIVALNLAGYVIFRGANLQKHGFRKNPSGLIWGAAPECIRTQQGTLLLASGWWGMSRHMNYLGDLMMGLAWCLPAGFEHPLPYFYIVYLATLLFHREWRDNARCREKYGSDWDAYCRKVPWRIVPGIY